MSSERAIDYDAGVLINVEPLSGIDVFMYVNQPGHYLNAHGKEVSEAIAKSAGFNTEYYAKERLRLERKMAANAIIDAELRDDNDTDHEIVSDKQGFKLVSIGLGRFIVRDPDDNLLTNTPMPREAAERFIDLMLDVKPEVKATKEAQKNAK